MKHPYATSLVERQQVPLFIAAAAFLVALGIGFAFKWAGFVPPAWLDVPSTAALYALGYKLFNQHVWKWSLLRKAGFVRTPILAGEWVGTVTTSFDQFAAKHKVSVSVYQDWTDIAIILRGQHSKSASVIAALAVSEEIGLSYEYCNEPLPDAVGTMHAHRGMAGVTLSADGKTLTGQYYSGRDRQNCGHIEIKRV